MVILRGWVFLMSEVPMYLTSICRLRYSPVEMLDSRSEFVNFGGGNELGLGKLVRSNTLRLDDALLILNKFTVHCTSSQGTQGAYLSTFQLQSLLGHPGPDVVDGVLALAVEARGRAAGVGAHVVEPEPLPDGERREGGARHHHVDGVARGPEELSAD